MGVSHGTNWPSEQKPGLGLYQQKYCQLRLKEVKKMIQTEGSLNMHYSSRKRKKDPKGNFRDHQGCYSHNRAGVQGPRLPLPWFPRAVPQPSRMPCGSALVEHSMASTQREPKVQGCPMGMIPPLQ